MIDSHSLIKLTLRIRLGKKGGYVKENKDERNKNRQV
jgi:hypothetical protein